MPHLYRQRKTYLLSPAATTTTEGNVQRRGQAKNRLMDFGTYFPVSLALVAADLTLGALDFRVLLFAIAEMDHQSRVPLYQAAIGDRLGVSRQAVNRSVRTLVEKGLLFRQGRTFSVNSRLASKKRLDDILIGRRAEIPLLREVMRRDALELRKRQAARGG